MNPLQPLTKRQREIYDFIAKFVKEYTFAPSLEEIATAMNLSSLATVHKHLENLRAKGYITRSWNRSRSTSLTLSAPSCPTCGRAFDLSLTAQNIITPEAKVAIETGRKSDTMGSTVDVSAPTVPTTTEAP